MSKFGYLLLIAVSFAAFNSCSNHYHSYPQEQNISYNLLSSKKGYGAYLAGRIAHYRMDFDSAADFYKQTAQKDTQNRTLLNRTYLMMASQGRVAEAAEYAELAQKSGDNSDIIPALIAAEKFKQKDYLGAINALKGHKSLVYKTLFSPFIEAWAYAGLGDYPKATAALARLKNEVYMDGLYHYHAGMIAEYFDKTEDAHQHFDYIVKHTDIDMSVRALETICNFYIRNDKQNKAVELAQQYASSVPEFNMLQSIYETVKNAKPEKTELLTSTPQMGLSESFFNIASIIKHNPDALDFSHIVCRLALYENPDNHYAGLLLSGILEMREMYKDAIAVYDKIPSTSPAYYIAQYKKAVDLRNLQDYKGSELLLKNLIADYPDNSQPLLDLGDTLRMQEKHSEALKYYRQALAMFPKTVSKMWQVYYAMGISLDQTDKWKEAEKMFQKALKLSPDNLLVMNYLGYSWLKQGRHPERAFEYIVKAYNQAPFNSSITDSLGWAFYRFGLYDEAINYLEKAVDNDPSNALINDHLGDAYWYGGRQNEALFQWNHALSLKDESGEVDRKDLKHKLTEGLPPHRILTYDRQRLEPIIESIQKEKTLTSTKSKTY